MADIHWEPLPSNSQILRRTMAGLEFRVYLDDDKRWSFTARGAGNYTCRTGYANLTTVKASACRLARKYGAGGSLEPQTALRGFASMTPEQRKQMASKGGQASQASGKSHRFGPQEAREAGRRGGALVAADRAYMAEIGRKGGANGKGKPKPHYKTLKFKRAL